MWPASRALSLCVVMSLVMVSYRFRSCSCIAIHTIHTIHTIHAIHDIHSIHGHPPHHSHLHHPRPSSTSPASSTSSALSASSGACGTPSISYIPTLSLFQASGLDDGARGEGFGLFHQSCQAQSVWQGAVAVGIAAGAPTTVRQGLPPPCGRGTQGSH